MSHSSHSALIGDQIVSESETESLKPAMKYHMKYGSTGSDHKSVNKYKYMTHTVQPTDTLQGLALRYEVTVEQIKKANNLWSNDNLWLRSRTHISIPVLLSETTIESPLYSSSTNSSTTTSPHKTQLKNGSHNSVTAHNNSSLESVDIPLDDKESSSSSRVESHDMHSANDSNNSSQRSALRRHHSSASRPHSANASGNQIHDFPQPLVMMTHKRKVKSSLKRLERTQDEIFEL
ncbi:unnamed protein product [Oppiella nova]|uniref:LysM domain-containing protein n=1 Tax=Oppiella nova TaxID=334625 RepID=A0A7R9M9V5_9ACAR|nr:unnamed protein product [Oppiella nova]CAG2173214.1 unnamed protein product [Oppiella nova]